MKKEEPDQNIETGELPDSWWHRVYLAVVVTTILVIAALWAFTAYFTH